MSSDFKRQLLELLGSDPDTQAAVRKIIGETLPSSVLGVLAVRASTGAGPIAVKPQRKTLAQLRAELPPEVLERELRKPNWLRQPEARDAHNVLSRETLVEEESSEC